jgi:hypothetical protein
MNRRTVIAAAAGGLLLAGTIAFAEEEKQSKPPMHMHKSEMKHRTDQEVATEYKTEAQQLREQAEAHRNLAQLYRSRTPPKGAGNYDAVAKHCDKLAEYFENAAKESDGVARELSR